MATLERGVELSLSTSVLGVPFRLETNSPEILEVGRATYGVTDDETAASASQPIVVRVIAAAELDGRPLSPPVVALPEPHRLEIDLGAAAGRADAIRGEAEASVSMAVVHSPAFREWVLDHLVLFLVTHTDRTPLHVGAVVRDGKALLLAGPSGRGKSSLTYAAMMDGCQVLADDVVFLQRRPARRLWSIPRDIHLPWEATRHFPELRAAPQLVRADGRKKIAVRVPAFARAPVPWSGSVGLCFLGEASNYARPERISAAVAESEMREGLQGGFIRFARSLGECIPALIEGGCWRVPVTVEPQELVRHLDDMFAST